MKISIIILFNVFIISVEMRCNTILLFSLYPLICEFFSVLFCEVLLYLKQEGFLIGRILIDRNEGERTNDKYSAHDPLAADTNDRAWPFLCASFEPSTR